jgi:hypothetical protein
VGDPAEGDLREDNNPSVSTVWQEGEEKRSSGSREEGRQEKKGSKERKRKNVLQRG